MNSRPLWIAISGPVASGKSTIASLVATELGFWLVDRGAVFRTVTKGLLNNGVEDFDSITAADFVDIAIRQENVLENGIVRAVTYLNSFDATKYIRAENMGRQTAQAAQNPLVHDFVDSVINPLLCDNSQRGVVMEGREVGTSVMGEAELKVFITAPLDVRVDRRFKQLIREGRNISRSEVRDNIIQRDVTDFRRSYRPLRRPHPEFLIRTQGIRAEEAANKVCIEFMSRHASKEGGFRGFSEREY